MKRSYRLAILFLTGLLMSCGSDRAAPPAHEVVAVTVSPVVVTMDQGATKQFIATVTGSANTAVVWSVHEGSAGGTINPQGVYTAPASGGVFHIIATSAADPNVRASVSVTVNLVFLSVSPTAGDMEPGSTQQFQATVTGTVNRAVGWSVVEPTGGSISKDGLYTAPTITGKFHVVASSAADNRMSATVPVMVATLAVLINPANIAMLPGNIRPFAASVSGCMDDRVTWAVQEGSAGGSITNSGVYTAPSELGQYHIVATSIAHPSLSGSARVIVGKTGFTNAADMTRVRFGHSATLLANGNVLLAGGGTVEGDVYSETKSTELFDSLSETFRASGDMNTARRWHTATALLDGRVLIAGGGIDGGWDYYPIDSAELYDPITERFTALGKMQAARLGHSATLLPNGKVLISGGYTPMDFLGTAELFDPATGTFTATGPMHETRSDHTAILLPDGRVIIMGGCWRCKDRPSASEIYDPATGQFTAAGSFPRIDHTATLLSGGRILATGGFSYDDVSQYTYYDDVQFFNPANGEATFAAKMSDYRIGHTATKLPDGTVLLAGGWDQEASSPVVEVFDPATASFVLMTSMTKTRIEHTATLLLDGRVLVTGGTSDRSAELFKQQP